MWIALALPLAAPALAAEPPLPIPKVWVGAGLSGAYGLPDAAGAGPEVRAGAALGPDPQRSLGLEGRIREVLHGPELRQVGGIGLVLRYPAGIGPYGGIGFSHHHDAAFSLALDHPVAVAAGTHPGIVHRTGFELDAGWDFRTFAPGIELTERFAWYAEFSAVALPDSRTPVVYGFLSLGLRGGVGPLVRPATSRIGARAGRRGSG